MKLKFIKNTVLLFVVVLISCGNRTTVKNESFPIVGANQLALYLPFLDGKNIGVVANQTTVIFKNNKELTGAHTHLVDSLLKLGIKIKKVFAPEHGYRGKADAGEYVKDGVDIKTGLPIVSLYGANRKPNSEILRDLDVVIFDVQDVGARFYTFVSTLHYMMETCATLNIPILILDRPNPNGHYIDGPILDLNHKSFVGMHPVPVVHGMTIGEYAKMINGEGWLENGIQCELKIISVANYYHKKTYNLPIKPSPNLPKAVDIALSYILVSPDMHKTHHHYKLPHTDSNYGNIFSIWDRFFGTYSYLDRDALIYGVDTYPDEIENSSLKSLLKQPFQPYRKPTTTTNRKRNECQ